MSTVTQKKIGAENALPQHDAKGRLRTVIFLAASLCLAAGCNTSGLYPVTGEVVDASGKPIPGLEKSNYVMFAQVPDGTSSSMGEILADGSFRLFTNKPGDGVAPGDYYVYLPRKHLDPERAMPQLVAGKFESIEQSGWTKTVEKKRNHFVLEVSPLPQRSTKR
jgi:hypothetical protein